MPRHYMTLVVLTLALAALACALPGLANTAVEPDDAGAATLYEDDFSSDLTGWDVYDDGESRTGYTTDGEFRIEIDLPEQVVWANANLQRPLDAGRIGVDVRSAGGGNDTGFGILCFYDEDARDFYYFEVGVDGYYSIMRVRDNLQDRVLAGDDFSTLIPVNAARYRVEVICARGQQALFINGTQIASANDDSLPGGDIGLIATTFQDSGAEVYFDNVTVTALP